MYLEHATAGAEEYIQGLLFSDSLSLKMKAMRFFETSVITQQHRHTMATSTPQALNMSCPKTDTNQWALRISTQAEHN
jgi:hypothetical protein